MFKNTKFLTSDGEYSFTDASYGALNKAVNMTISGFLELQWRFESAQEWLALV